MALNGIDISNWQSGINLAVVPCDFVVIKATEGTGYVNPDYERAYRQAKTAGHLSLCVWWKYTGGGRIFSEECREPCGGGNACAGLGRAVQSGIWCE